MVEKKQMVEVKEEPKQKREQKERVFASVLPKAIKDERGRVITKLRITDFPNTREGRVAWAEFQIAKWTEQRDRYKKFFGDAGKKAARLERLREQLAQLEKELAAGI